MKAKSSRDEAHQPERFPLPEARLLRIKSCEELGDGRFLQGVIGNSAGLNPGREDRPGNRHIGLGLVEAPQEGKEDPQKGARAGVVISADDPLLRHISNRRLVGSFLDGLPDLLGVPRAPPSSGAPAEFDAG